MIKILQVTANKDNLRNTYLSKDGWLI